MIKIEQKVSINTEKLFKAIYDDSPIGIEIYDSNGKLIDLNQSCMELFGVSSKDDVKGFDLLNDPNIPKDYLKKLKQRQTVHFESSFDFELVKKNNLYKTKKSGKMYLDVLITPLFIEDNKKLSNYLVQIQDVSSQKIAQHKLIALNEELEKEVRKRTGQIKKSEENWEFLVKEAPDIIFTVDRNRRILYINQVPKGMTPDQALGTDALEYVAPDYHKIVKNSIEKVFETGDTDYYEISARGPDETPSWYSTRLKAIKQNEEVVSVMLITRDITERKEAELKSKESEEKFRTISDQSLVGITIAQNGIIKYVNKQMEELSGYSLEEMKSWNAGEFLKIIHPDYRELVAEQSKKKQLGQNDVIEQYQIMGIKKSGDYIWVDNFSKTITFEGKSAVLSIMIDITEKKEAEQRLKNSEKRYRTLINNILDIIYEIDLDGKITYLSPQTVDMLGYDPTELIGRNAFRFIHPDDQPKVSENQNYVINSGEIGFVEFRIRHKEGRYLTVSSRGQFIEKEGEKRIIGLFRDVTERKKIEDKVQKEKEKAEMYLNLVNVIIVALDNDGNISMINKEGNDLLGWKEGDLIGKSWFENCLPPQDIDRVFDYFKKLMKGELDIVPFYENPVITKDGDEKLIAWSTLLFKDADGKITGALSSGVDITEKKKAEEKLRESEKRLTDLLEAVPVGISITTPKGKIIECNSHAYKIYGYNLKEEFLNIPVTNLYQNPTDRANFLKLHEEGLVKDFESKFKRKDGTIFWGSLTSVAQKVGNQTTFINSFQDITNRKTSEIKLQQSEAELSAIYNYTPIAILLVDKERRIRKINKFALNFTDRRKEDVFGMQGGEVLRCVYSIQDPRGCGYSNHCQECIIRNTILETYNSKTPYINVEATLHLLPGSIVDKAHLLLSTVPIESAGEDLVLISLIDITERKITEEKLKESEERFKFLISTNPAVIYTSKASGNFGATFVSDNIKDLTGYEPDDYTSDASFWVDRIHYDDKELILNQLSHLFEKDYHSHEYRFKFKDGTYHWMRDELKLIRDDKGNPSEIIGFWIDITEKKIAEQKLRESEEKYRTVVNNIPGMVYRGNPDWSVEFLSNCEVISGYTEEDFLTQKLNWIDLIHQEEREVITNQGKLLSEKPLTLSQVYRIIMKDGFIRWINDRKTSFFDENGIFRGVDGIVYDINDYKIAEQKLKESEERFKYLVSSSPTIIYTSRTSGDYGATFISDNVEEKWGYDPKLFIEDSDFWLSHIHQEDREHVLEALSSLFDKDHITYEYRFELNNGTYLWMRDEVMLIRDESGVPLETIGSVIDITERVNAEQELKESEEKFRNIAEQTSLGLLIQQDGIIKFANSAVSEISEYSIEEINTWSVEDFIKLIHEEDLPLVNTKINLVRSDEFVSSDNFELRLITKSGSMKWVEFITKPIIYLGKKAVFSTLIDTTAKKKLEEELKEISKLKSELISRTSHELKTPLVSIKGYANLLLTQHYEELDFYTVSVLHEINQGCYRLESLIKDLLETSELETGEVILNKLEDDLAFLIRFCVKDLRGLIEMRKHEIILEIQDNLITLFEKERIYEVIMNLLSNAIKYTPPNGKISIKSKIQEEGIIISVEDNGIGLTKEEKDKLFKKFGKIERYGKGLDVISEGSGLGLYISKKIIELHGGNIWVESKGKDKGSTFYFSLPIFKQK